MMISTLVAHDDDDDEVVMATHMSARVRCNN